MQFKIITYTTCFLLLTLMIQNSVCNAQNNNYAPQITSIGYNNNNLLLPGDPLVIRANISWPELASRELEKAVRAECWSKGFGSFVSYREKIKKSTAISLNNENVFELQGGAIDSNETEITCQVCNGYDVQLQDFSNVSCSEKVTIPVQNIQLLSHTNWQNINPGDHQVVFENVLNTSNYRVTILKFWKNWSYYSRDSKTIDASTNSFSFSIDNNIDLVNINLEALDNEGNPFKAGSYSFVTFRKPSLSIPYSDRNDVNGLKADPGGRLGNNYTPFPILYKNIETGRIIGTKPKEFGRLEAKFCVNYYPIMEFRLNLKEMSIPSYCDSKEIVMNKVCSPAEYDSQSVPHIYKMANDPLFIPTCISRGIIKEYNFDKGTERVVLSSLNDRFLFLDSYKNNIYYTKLNPETRIDDRYAVDQTSSTNKTDGLWVFDQNNNTHTKLLSGDGYTIKVIGDWGVVIKARHYQHTVYQIPVELKIIDLRNGSVKVENNNALINFFSNPYKSRLISWNDYNYSKTFDTHYTLNIDSGEVSTFNTELTASNNTINEMYLVKYKMFNPYIGWDIYDLANKTKSTISGSDLINFLRPKYTYVNFNTGTGPFDFFNWVLDGEIIKLNIKINSINDPYTTLEPENIRVDYNIKAKQFSYGTDPIPVDSVSSSDSYLIKDFNSIRMNMSFRLLIEQVPYLKIFDSINKVTRELPFASANMQSHYMVRQSIPNISFTTNSSGERVAYFGDIQDTPREVRNEQPPVNEEAIFTVNFASSLKNKKGLVKSSNNLLGKQYGHINVYSNKANTNKSLSAKIEIDGNLCDIKGFDFITNTTSTRIGKIPSISKNIILKVHLFDGQQLVKSEATILYSDKKKPKNKPLPRKEVKSLCAAFSKF